MFEGFRKKKIMRNILLISIAGFIGSNFVPYFLNKYPEYTLVNLDLLTYTGNLENLKECACNSRYKFIKSNICNHELVEFIFNKYNNILGLIHFAGESHVDNSISLKKMNQLIFRLQIVFAPFRC